MPLKLTNSGLVAPFATEPDCGFPAVTGTVRPPTPTEVADYRDQCAGLRGAKLARAQAEFFARHVRTWDVEGEDGAPAPVHPGSMLALPFPVFAQLERVVIEAGGTDAPGN